MNKNYQLAITALKQGRVIAYPTEAVFGLGCDPTNEQAVLSLLKIKQRPIHKGLILVAGDFELLAPFVDINTINNEMWHKINMTWPGAVTWVLPKSAQCPDWISGQFDSVAVRVSAHPVIQQLASEFGCALVSTSANPSGIAPAVNAQQVSMMFGESLGMIIDAPLGASNKPSEIFDGMTGQQFR
ncbi:MAG: threonylcarbamoyl-AMP synthase [Gammaproteobacteria bacterium]|nr:threonylcarbamoyl-AMP synthase [Gammaproteobacteria bacterium]